MNQEKLDLRHANISCILDFTLNCLCQQKKIYKEINSDMIDYGYFYEAMEFYLTHDFKPDGDKFLEKYKNIKGIRLKEINNAEEIFEEFKSIINK